MEKKIEKILEEKKIELYVANDGTKFKSYRDCIEHEQAIADEALKESPDVIECGDAESHMPFNGMEYYENHTYRWFKALNEKGIELLNKTFGDVVDKEYIGEWTCFEISDDDVYTTRLDKCAEYVRNLVGKLGVNLYLTPVAVELCPHCRREVEMAWNVNEDGYKAFCPHCGKRLMLCDECQHRGEESSYTDDCNYDSNCDTCRFNDSEFEYLLNYVKSSESDYSDKDDLKTLRTLWTAYCYHKNIDVDTEKYDSKLSKIWDALYGKSHRINDAGFDKFERYMCKHLV